MGTDIHLAVEKRSEKGEWRSVHDWRVEDEYGDQYLHQKDPDRWDFGRSYRTFAVLADVRNGHGFAGIDTGDRVEPISEARGLPDDASDITRSWAGDWGHDYSWLTLAEIMEYDWTQTVENRGVLSAIEFHQWDGYWRKHGDSPKSWSGDVSGAGVKKISEEEMREGIKAAIASLPKSHVYQDEIDAIGKAMPSTYVHCAWTQPIYRMCGEFLSKIVPQLWALADGDYDSVRIVFFFDS